MYHHFFENESPLTRQFWIMTYSIVELPANQITLNCSCQDSPYVCKIYMGRLNVKLSFFNARQLSRRCPLQILHCILENEWLSIACQANEEDILFMINVLVYIPTLNYVWYQNMKMHKPTMHRQYANTQMTIHVV